MLKKSSTPTSSYTTSFKTEVKEAPKVNTPQVEESPKPRPGSFAALISQ